MSSKYLVHTWNRVLREDPRDLNISGTPDIWHYSNRRRTSKGTSTDAQTLPCCYNQYTRTQSYNSKVTNSWTAVHTFCLASNYIQMKSNTFMSCQKLLGDGEPLQKVKPSPGFCVCKSRYLKLLISQHVSSEWWSNMARKISSSYCYHSYSYSSSSSYFYYYHHHHYLLLLPPPTSFSFFVFVSQS